MEVYKSIMKMEQTCVAFGEFDCIHRGHRAVVEAVVHTAKDNALKSVIVSIPEDGAVFTTEEEKEYLLKDADIDYLFTYTEKTEHFVEEIIIKKLGARIIVVGENHTNLEQLKKTAAEYEVNVILVKDVKENDISIHKSLIKKAFEDCDYEKMTSLLGHPYIMLAEVVHGKALGRTVGMPTANLQVPNNKIKPLDGVYCTRIILDNELFLAMTNIGKRPSVDTYDYVTIEAFILDFSRDIYGKQLVLEVHKFIRGVIKFDNLEQVQAQVQKDIAEVRNLLDKIS